MKTMSVGEFEKQFASALEIVKKGEPVGITSGTDGETVAVLVPPGQDQANAPRKLGLLAGKAKAIIHDNWEMTDEEFLNSWRTPFQ